MVKRRTSKSKNLRICGADFYTDDVITKSTSARYCGIAVFLINAKKSDRIPAVECLKLNA